MILNTAVYFPNLRAFGLYTSQTNWKCMSYSMLCVCWGYLQLWEKGMTFKRVISIYVQYLKLIIKFKCSFFFFNNMCQISHRSKHDTFDVGIKLKKRKLFQNLNWFYINLLENHDEKPSSDFIYAIITTLVNNSCVINLKVWQLINKFSWTDQNSTH